MKQSPSFGGMTTFTIQAVYKAGVLEPRVKIDLPDNTPVQVQVTPLPTAQPVPGSLFGAFPELGVLNADDVQWAKRLWEHNLDRQSRQLDGLD